MNPVKALIKYLFFSSTGRISWFKTIIFNYRCFDFRTASKLPIYIYNKTDIIYLNKVSILCKEIKSGMIKIGSWQMKARGNTKLRLYGELRFHGPAEIWGGSIIEVEGNGTLDIGGYVRIAESCKIMCAKSIILNDSVRLGYETTIMDTDYHYLIDINNHIVKRNTASVVIGSCTWVSSNCKILKGSVIPKFSVLVGGSLVNKDFSDIQSHTIFVGSPAKPQKYGYHRIYNLAIERELDEYFRNNSYSDYYKFDSQCDFDSICFDNQFSIDNKI